VNNKIEILTTHFSLVDEFKANLNDFSASFFNIDTNFDISTDSFPIINSSSDLSGTSCSQACWGFVHFSNWFFKNKKADDCNLRKAYGDNSSYASIACNANDDQWYPWNIIEEQFDESLNSCWGLGICDPLTAGSLLLSLKLNNKPLYLDLFPDSGVGHSVLVVGWDANNSCFFVYDPNYNDALKPIFYNASTNRFIVYDSGGIKYTNFNYVSSNLLSDINMAIIGENIHTIQCEESLSDTEDPTIPTGFTATAVSASQINLSWTASTDNVGVTGYKIYRDGFHLKSVTSNSASDTGLNTSTKYCYTVSAYDAAGNESDQSDEACATTSSDGSEIFFDHFDDGNYADKWSINRDDGSSTVIESGSELHVQIEKPTSNCDAFYLDSTQTFSGDSIVVEAKIKQLGWGGAGIAIRKDDDNSVLMRLSTNDTPCVQFFSNKNGASSKQQCIESSSPYLGDYNTFKIVKSGDDYDIYLNGNKKGNTFTNTGIGDSNLTVFLDSHTCAWKSGDSDNYFDYVKVTAQ
jgi:hypothetical protein